MSARLGAFFFLPRQEPMPSLDELANAAGMTALDPRALAVDRATEVRYGDWGGLKSVRARLYRLDLHDCLALDFWLTMFFDMRARHTGQEAVPLEEDGALPVALAFRDACERLRPEAAVLATHPHLAENPDWMRECYSAVLGMDPNSLDSMAAGITYVSSDMVDEWVTDRFGPPQRDSLPVKSGLLLFRGTGWSRWF